VLRYIAVAVGGAVGAVARFWLGSLVAQMFPSRFPYGTLIINVSGSFIIGFFLTLAMEKGEISPIWRLGVATGFVGAYTTFSAFEFESFKMMESGDGIAGVLNVLVSLMLGFLAVWAGIALARKLDYAAFTNGTSRLGLMLPPVVARLRARARLLRDQSRSRGD
jgi:CrcB protein